MVAKWHLSSQHHRIGQADASFVAVFLFQYSRDDMSSLGSPSPQIQQPWATALADRLLAGGNHCTFFNHDLLVLLGLSLLAGLRLAALRLSPAALFFVSTLLHFACFKTRVAPLYRVQNGQPRPPSSAALTVIQAHIPLV